MATLNINNTDNQVTAVNANQSIIITDNGSTTQTSIAVTQPVTSVVLVNTLGPQGVQGIQGPSGSSSNIDTSSFVTTSSFNSFTSSYQIDSSSFDTKINNLILATSSYVLNSQTSSFVTNNQTSSMAVSSSLTSSFLIPGTYLITSSWAESGSNAITASYASTASYVTGIRSGVLGNGQWGGGGANNYTSSFINFTPPFPDTQYSVTILGQADARMFTIQQKSGSRFRINSNEKLNPITGNVMWMAIYYTQ